MDTEAQIIHEDTKQQKDDNQDLDMSPFFLNSCVIQCITNKGDNVSFGFSNILGWLVVGGEDPIGQQMRW